MSKDAAYKPLPYIFNSMGIMARFATDRAPGEGYYLNLQSADEREEKALSSRYGSVVINRDPAGIGTSNYFFGFAPVAISRLVNGALTYRYVGLSNGTLQRRATDTQGIFTQIATTLSGQPFSSFVSACFQSAQPYLFIADQSTMLKDSGIGNPVSWGIPIPPTQVANTSIYNLLATAIDSFQSAAGYTSSGMGALSFGTIVVNGVNAVVNGTGGTSIFGGNYEAYNCSDKSSRLVQDGFLGVSGNGHGTGIKFNTSQDTTTFDIVAFGGAYSAADSFTYSQVQGNVAANATGTIGKTANFNFSALTPDDLFVLVISVSAPQVIQEIRLQFDVNGSNYTSSYYYKSIAPTAFQGGVSSPQNTDPAQAVTGQVSGRAGGTVNLTQIGTLPLAGSKPYFLGDGDPVPRLQPKSLTTGASSWTVVYIRKGDFLPVGNADSQGLDWSNITGWQIETITSTLGSTTVAFNALYTQTGSGPSSYGGAGYDYRYTYFDATTQTESNPSAQQYFPITPTNPAGVSTLFVLRQTVNISGQYSNNSRVTHVRIYRRGGTLPGPAWLLVDQIPNVVGTGTFNYRDLFTDAAITIQPQLSVTNDAPVTSTLQNPIVTTLNGALNPTAPFTPITVTVNNGSAVFVKGQIVNIGNAADFEQVLVSTGGTGSFQACVQLAHANGEPVQVFSKPNQPVNLSALAYNQIWLAGDPNNPHLLYYSNPGFPENFPPQNYIAVSSPADPIMAVINFRGTLFVATRSTWYQIYPSSPPVPQPTGSKHGMAAQFGWTQTENSIWYQSFDGIREFSGTDGAYRTALIEWLFQNQPTSPSPSPLVPLSQPNIGQVLMAFWNNHVFVIYPGIDGNNHRLIFDTVYNRWHNDDLYVNAINYEADTNTLVIGRIYKKGASQNANWALAQDQVGDFDDQGWLLGALVPDPINLTIQTPYFDQGQPNNPKDYNMVTVDANANGQALVLTLLFNDNDGTIAPIVLPFTGGTTRQKFQFTINGGFGQTAYRMSAQLSGSVTVAPIIYQMEMQAVMIAALLNSYDTYWIKFGTDESKLVKQGYFDYTSTLPVTVNLYANGNPSPYYSFILPANPTRFEVPMRVRFQPAKLRMFRLIATCAGTMQFHSAPQMDQKAVITGKGYSKSELVTS